ncbi:hypothetical protein [Hymenobacter metallilatus]|uniref:Lipoprotein n=1 Tax=Hymenobacter metallilatus TaxID=2493666 RepID=A0A428JGR4_9BACT|nr:hypothetical protein [Hymenobacter metallilatus]RSK31763.1 hypothetical protein EI290_13115 [Hymenobacter metallilatus]
MKFTLSAWFIGGLALLVGCTSDEPIPQETQAWLHDTDGTVLTFQNTSTGVAEPVEVHIRRESQRTGSGRFTIRHTRVHQAYLYYYINPQPAVPITGLGLEFADNQVTVAPDPNYWTDSRIFLQTAADEAQETATAETQASVKLTGIMTLNGQAYGRCLWGKFTLAKGSQPTKTDDVAEFFYTKDQGLVAYTKANGQMWMRVK